MKQVELTHTCLVFYKRDLANSVDRDQTLQSAASAQGILCIKTRIFYIIIMIIIIIIN